MISVCHGVAVLFEYTGHFLGWQLKPAVLGSLSLMSSNIHAPSYTHPGTATEPQFRTLSCFRSGQCLPALTGRAKQVQMKYLAKANCVLE